MKLHYSQPKGFVGRNICYEISYNRDVYGYIVGGSASLHLPNRNEFFGIKGGSELNSVVNNLFFRLERINGKYPCRNFNSLVLSKFIDTCSLDWMRKYGNRVVGFETLVELPRTGESYIRAGWSYIGTTKGYTAKRTSGKGTDAWTGKRVWDTKNLKPKLVFAKKVNCEFVSLGQEMLW